MSDTITIALITAVTAILSAGIGAFTAWKTAKLSADKEQERRLREDKRNCYSRLISSYNVLCGAASASLDSTDGAKELELYTQFQTARNDAILICDDNTQQLIFTLSKQVTACHLGHGDPDELRHSYVSALQAMRRELGGSMQERIWTLSDYDV